MINRVGNLLKSNKDCVFCSSIGCFHIQKLSSIINISPTQYPLEKKVSESTLTFKKSFWKDKDVFAYIKSQDNRWLYENDKDLKSQSHYAKQYCEYPWSSLTVMADGNLLTVAEAAERLFGKNDTAAYKRTLHLINSGKIHHLKLGRKILIATLLLSFSLLILAI